MSKIMERTICKHMLNYNYENDLIYKYQAGFYQAILLNTNL